MKTVTYSCDKCKKEFEQEDLLIFFLKGFFERDEYANYFKLEKKIELCKGCAKEMGFDLIKYRIEEEDNPKTQEKRVFDILQEMLQIINSH
jgi:uncharacterized metal-binding protein